MPCAVGLVISTNSNSGKPIAGVGSAIISLIFKRSLWKGIFLPNDWMML